MTENFLKPKDMASRLNITPKRTSNHATEIEEANVHTFNRTPLGSFLFLEEEEGILKEYEEIKMFFERKFEAQKMLREQMLEKEPNEDLEWMKLLKNAEKTVE